MCAYVTNWFSTLLSKFYSSTMFSSFFYSFFRLGLRPCFGVIADEFSSIVYTYMYIYLRTHVLVDSACERENAAQETKWHMQNVATSVFHSELYSREFTTYALFLTFPPFRRELRFSFFFFFPLFFTTPCFIFFPCLVIVPLHEAVSSPAALTYTRCICFFSSNGQQHHALLISIFLYLSSILS